MRKLSRSPMARRYLSSNVSMLVTTEFEARNPFPARPAGFESAAAAAMTPGLLVASLVSAGAPLAPSASPSQQQIQTMRRSAELRFGVLDAGFDAEWHRSGIETTDGHRWTQIRPRSD